MPNLYIKTYGCQMNEQDSRQVSEMLMARGYCLVKNEEEADVILLNTCSVREMAERKAIGKMGMLRKLRYKRPRLILGYLGCMAQIRGAELLNISPYVDLVVGTQKTHRVAEYVDTIFRRLQQARIDDERLPIVEVGEEQDPPISTLSHTRRTPTKQQRVTAFVSIMQGCNMHCAFCIVPKTRGSEKSRSMKEVVEEVQTLVDEGVSEVILLGQIVNFYGRHSLQKVDNKTPFVQLIERIHQIEGLERIRFTSPHPIGFQKDLIDCFARLPKLMEHVHLPLQSGSDRILKSMHRGYTVATYLRLVEKLRAVRPDLAISTDLIVGFPGETEEDHLATQEVYRAAGFDHAFIFRYSPRKATSASAMQQQVSEDIKEARNRDLLHLLHVTSERKLATRVGTRMEILCEGPSKTNPSRFKGRTRTNQPVIFDGSNRHVGRIFDVLITGSSASTLYADPALSL
ncbi:MAG: tRNA (N6-isopentenyl adenosine(37)-C2)-methylthiotransferase MiaB [Candidatus Xiphinematobacter sp.]|nr:MAG: tRNA (N6-isopentenyl adenosine(37)-C2)-methylthiotransferase MiaB [Candidatus Xiphinematobacter sp.]